MEDGYEGEPRSKGGGETMAGTEKHKRKSTRRRDSLTIRRCFHEVTVVKKNCIHFALRFSSLPSLRENKDDKY